MYRKRLSGIVLPMVHTPQNPKPRTLVDPVGVLLAVCLARVTKRFSRSCQGPAAKFMFSFAGGSICTTIIGIFPKTIIKVDFSDLMKYW